MDDDARPVADDPRSAGDVPEQRDDDAYGGLFGAFPYAIKSSDSWLFRSYAVVGGLAALLAGLVFVFGVIDLLGDTSVPTSGTVSLTQAFFIVIALAVVVPILAPVLAVARWHRFGIATRDYDGAMGVAGYAFLASLYAALVISVPPSAQEPTGGVVGPVVEFLYALPQWAGLIPVGVAAATILLLHRFAKRRTGPGEADADGGTG
ncbi:MAG TPA: hypothetical protein VJ898_07775 [Natrialbaceae archaeon]|nr:hypothetical protein [Natrialbaceae archaeon]